MIARILSPVIALVILGASATALASGGTAAVLPATGEGIDSITLGIVTETLAEKVSIHGYQAVDADRVTQAASQACPSGVCTDPLDIIAVGEALEADQVVMTHLEREGEDVVVQIIAFDVAAGTNEQAAAKTAPSGVLAKVVKLLGIVMPEPASVTPEPVEPGPTPVVPGPQPPEPEPPSGDAPDTQAGVGTGSGDGTAAPIPPGGESADPGSAGEPDGEDPGGKGEEEGEKKPEVEKDQSGRLDVAVTSATYALTMTFSIMYAAGVGEDRWYLYPPFMLLGGGGALAIALLSTMKAKVTSGDAAMYSTCLGIGSSNGLLIPMAAGRLEAKPILLGSAIGGGIGLTAGILTIALTDPTRGDSALVSTVSTWGSAYATMISAMAAPANLEAYFIAAVVGLDVGLAAGAVTAGFVEVSPRRLGIISLAGFLGTALGATVGIPLLLKTHVGNKEVQGYFGIMMGFTTLGIVLGAVFTDKLGEKKGKRGKKKDAKKGKVSAQPYLVAHDESGWSLGVPGIAPVTTPDGSTMVPGAQISIMGGTF